MKKKLGEKKFWTLKNVSFVFKKKLDFFLFGTVSETRLRESKNMLGSQLFDRALTMIRPYRAARCVGRGTVII